MKCPAGIPSEQLSYFDFHTHILPGIDDGSRNTEQSVKMLEVMKEQKVSFIAATPHYYASVHSPEEFLAERDAATERLRKEQICSDFDIRIGAEVQYYEGISRLEHPERFCLEGTNIFLLEMPFMPWNDRILSDVRTLCENSDVCVMIAHIERYIRIQPANLICALENMDVLLQCNAEFFLSPFTRRKALRMMKQGKIHAIGSDSHGLKSRTPNVGLAMEIIEKRLGLQFLRHFLHGESKLIYGEGD